MSKKLFCESLFSPLPGASRSLRELRFASLEWDAKGIIQRVKTYSQKDFDRASKSHPRYACVIPGLVDPHTHLIFSGHRAEEWGLRLKGADYEEIAKKGGGIRTTVKATRNSSIPELLKIGQSRAEKFLSFGVTTLEAKSGYGLSLESELNCLKALAQLKKKTPLQIFSTFMGAHALAPEFETTKAYASFIQKEMLPKVRGLADFQDVFVERGYFRASESIELLKAGKAYGLKPKVHAHEFGRTGGVKVACEVGAVSADHLQYLSTRDMKDLKKAKVVPVVLSGTSFFLGGKKYAPARQMWDVGLPVALATDFNPGTNPSWNFPMVGSMAAIMQGLSLEEVLVAQTKHAALALGLRDRGVLAKSYRADFVALEAKRFEEMYYHYASPLVKAVFIGGKKVF